MAVMLRNAVFPTCPSVADVNLQRQTAMAYILERAELSRQPTRKALRGVAVSSWFIYSFWEMLILFRVPFFL